MLGLTHNAGMVGTSFRLLMPRQNFPRDLKKTGLVTTAQFHCTVMHATGMQTLYPSGTNWIKKEFSHIAMPCGLVSWFRPLHEGTLYFNIKYQERRHPRQYHQVHHQSPVWGSFEPTYASDSNFQNPTSGKYMYSGTSLINTHLE